MLKRKSLIISVIAVLVLSFATIPVYSDTDTLNEYEFNSYIFSAPAHWLPSFETDTMIIFTGTKGENVTLSYNDYDCSIFDQNFSETFFDDFNNPNAGYTVLRDELCALNDQVQAYRIDLDMVGGRKNFFVFLDKPSGHVKIAYCTYDEVKDAELLMECEELLKSISLVFADNDVIELVQECLNTKGYDCGIPDGMAGPNTQSAINAYRNDNNLSQGDGIDDELVDSLDIRKEIHGLFYREKSETLVKTAATNSSSESEKSEIESYIRSHVRNTYKDTQVDSVTINEDFGTDLENDYIALVNLTWNVKNGVELTEEVLQMYSSDLAANIADDLPNVQELAIFWKVPYHGENTSKWSYERRGDKMYLSDKVLGF